MSLPETHALVGLGGNLPFEGERGPALFAHAIAAIKEAGLPVLARSRVWESAAWPNPADPPFANAAVRLEVGARTAPEVYALLAAIEARFGRVRGQRNAPRTLDLDLIDMGRRTGTGRIQLPHPRACTRGFVLAPLAEIAPDWRCPIHQTSAAAHLSALLPDPALRPWGSPRALDPDSDPGK